MAIGLASVALKGPKGLKALGSLPNLIHISGFQQSCSALGCNIRKFKSTSGDPIEDNGRPRALPASPQHKAPPRPPATAAETALGLTIFAIILFVTGAAPSAVPSLFYAFLAIGLPWRVYDFAFNSAGYNLFYLFDFCYWVNAAVAALLATPSLRTRPGLAVAVLSLADGPVGGALLAWRCRWAFGSAEHTISTLMHLLPGLAMFAHWHLPPGAASWREHGGPGAPSRLPDVAAWSPRTRLLWGVLAPLAFYAAWQLWYWLAVQVVFEGHIQRRGRDTSYRCLTRRAKRAQNFLARIVLRGSKARRIVAYGVIQAIYTLGTLALVQSTVDCFWAGCAWQVAKLAWPLWAGCKHQERLVQRQLSIGSNLSTCGSQSDLAMARLGSDAGSS